MNKHLTNGVGANMFVPDAGKASGSGGHATVLMETADGTKMVFRVQSLPFIITVKTDDGLKEYVLSAHLGPGNIRSMTLR